MPSAIDSPEVNASLSPLKAEVGDSNPLQQILSNGRLQKTIDPLVLEKASSILEVIDRYRITRGRNTPAQADEGALKFLAVIYSHVKANATIPMCLPAFPFKSPNSSKKVLGKLPDRAEALAISHLNGLCQAIGDIYPPGAALTIISDGLVYNDLLGVPDKDVWAYGEALRALTKAQNCDHISFSRIRDLVPMSLPEEMDEMTYIANASNFRRALINTHGQPSQEWKEVIKNEDTCMTYRGYIKFLETDLQDVFPQSESRSKSKYKKGIEYIAKQMLHRGAAFASAVRLAYGDHVRLSIHPSTGASKLSISLLPTSSMYTTPWHCSVAFMLDGTVLSGMRSEFDQNEALELVFENDRPCYYREKSPLWTWAEEKGGIVVEPLYPSGLMIKPAQGKGSLSIEDVDAEKVRALSELNSPVVLRNFAKVPNRDLFVKKAEEFGKPLPWKFGLVLEVKDQGTDTRGLNNVLSAEWMPFHFDGLFKTVTKRDNDGQEYRQPDPPRFQFFEGVTSSPRDTGFTLFSSSTLIFKYLCAQVPLETLSRMTWSVSTSSFDNTAMGRLPLVVEHPTTGKPCLRYHEPWPQSKTQFDATMINIEGLSEPDSAALCDAIDSVLHDRRVAYYHSWEKGDMLHTWCVRTSSRQCRRIMEAKTSMQDAREETPPAATPSTNQPPNGGLKAWMQVAGVFCLYFCTWGLVSSYGTYQTIYEIGQLQSSTPFEISVIGSLQIFLMVFLGFLTGPVFDAGYCRYLLTSGSLLIVVGTVLQSLCRKYWQYLLTQGLLVGLGTGLLAIPTVAIPAQWFSTKLPIANGISASGSGLGGVVLPIMIKRMEAQVGLPWATRAVALIFLLLLVVANLVLRPQKAPKEKRTRRSLVDATAFKDWPYVLLVLGMFITLLGLYTPFVHVQSYAIDKGLASEELSFYMVAILNSSSIPGRILPLTLAQQIGPMNMIVITAAGLGITSLCLTTATSLARLLVAIVFYGFFVGTLFALLPTLIVRMTSDIRRVGSRFGMAFATFSVAFLFGPPVAGALRREYNYNAAWIWAGTVTLVGGVVNALARMNKAGWKAWARV
ncbi:putative pyoverdine/dityrosine biosynthesis protein [Paramyrothecium foliicola]|nr:putative pyoverdine/dityrosine biosynthesis protein [Paramyrothecium foliicola]